jgi:hypothetical protein
MGGPLFMRFLCRSTMGSVIGQYVRSSGAPRRDQSNP